MFHRWGMRHGHPAFAWGGEYQPGPGDEGQAGFRGGPGPFGAHWGGWIWGLHGFGGGPGRGPGGPRAFGRGDLKFQLLSLLTDRPKHGYEMIKELEAQAGGFYTPSAGA